METWRVILPKSAVYNPGVARWFVGEFPFFASAGQISGRVPDDEDRARRLLQFRYPNSMPPKKVFHPRRPVIAVLEPDELGRRATLFGQVEKIRVSRYDNETVSPGPNGLVRGE